MSRSDRTPHTPILPPTTQEAITGFLRSVLVERGLACRDEADVCLASTDQTSLQRSLGGTGFEPVASTLSP